MDFGLSRDTEVTSLISGGRTVYRAPTGYKSYGMSWGGKTMGLQSIVDMYEGAYGEGPFYMFDPRYENDNLLPARWATPSQLAHTLGGWRRPQVLSSGDPTTGDGRQLYLSSLASEQVTPSTSRFATTTVLLKQYQSVYLSAHGYSSPPKVPGVLDSGIEWRGIRKDGTVGEKIIFTPNGSGNQKQILTPDHDYIAIRISLLVPRGGYLSLTHMDVSHSPMTDGLRSGKGVGPVQFSDDMQGTLIGAKVDRIGLSVGIVEIETDMTPGGYSQW